MATSYTSLLGLALPITGELQGTWGDTVNDSITSLLDTAVAGTTTISTDGDVTLTTTTGAANQSRQAILLFSGARTALRTITAPAQSKVYVVINATSGGYGVKLVGAGPTTGLTIPNGSVAFVVWNGSDFVEVGSSTIGNLIVNGNLTVTGTVNLDGGTIDNTAIGSSTAASGAFTTLSASSTATLNTLASSGATLTGGSINNMAIGGSTAAAGTFTALTATSDSSFTSTGALTVSKGTTAQRPGSAASGMFRFNTSTGEFEGYNGSAWSSVGGAAITNDTSTSTNIYPLLAGATSGTASTVYTSNAKLLYKPSTGEFQSSALVASNGIVVNSATVSANYTIATGNNAMSAGPVAVDSGITVTVSSGSVWTVI